MKLSSYQAWVIYKESNWFSAIIWIILLAVFGRYEYMTPPFFLISVFTVLCLDNYVVEENLFFQSCILQESCVLSCFSWNNFAQISVMQAEAHEKLQ